MLIKLINQTLLSKYRLPIMLLIMGVSFIPTDWFTLECYFLVLYFSKLVAMETFKYKALSAHSSISHALYQNP